MTLICNERVSLSRFKQWHEILCETNGRYNKNPIYSGDFVYVDYKPGDYDRQCDLYGRITTPIIELRRDQKWRVLLRRIFLWHRYV